MAESWSSIDAQLKRRADLIPSLVETVKGYAAIVDFSSDASVAQMGALAGDFGTR